MKEFIEDLIDTLKLSDWHSPATYDEDGGCEYESEEVVNLDEAIKIIHTLAKEYGVEIPESWKQNIMEKFERVE